MIQFWLRSEPGQITVQFYSTLSIRDHRLLSRRDAARDDHVAVDEGELEELSSQLFARQNKPQTIAGDCDCL